MIFAEGILIGAWILVWASVWLAIKVLLAGRAPSTSLGVMT